MIQNVNMIENEILGKGSYGTVIKRGDKAVKIFIPDDKRRNSSVFNSLIQELCIIKYFNKSNYTLDIFSYDLHRKEIVIELYDCTLKEYINYNFTFEEKEKIFIDVVKGLADFHSKDIIHSDLKLCNILINLDPLKVVLCDFGLSGVKNHARMYNTAPISRPDVSFPGYEYVHDMFGLCVAFLQVFGDIQLKKGFVLNMTRRKLRKCINKVINDDRVKEILLGCIKDDPEDIITAVDILRRYSRCSRYRPLRISMPEEYRRIRYKHVKSAYLRISMLYGIDEKYKLGCKLFSYIYNRHNDKSFCLHVVIFVISCLYKRYQKGEERLTKELILDKFTRRDGREFDSIISNIVDDYVALNILLGRKYISG